MTFGVEIEVAPLPALLDPRGKAAENGLRQLGFESVSNVRVGKFITLEIEAANETEARALAENACKKLLANPVMEAYRFRLTAR